MGKSMLAPHASVAGFAIFLVVYATQIWGGVFPFLPTDFQTQEVTLTFYLSQSLAFCASYVASAFGSYYVPSAARRMLVTLSISLTFIGSCFIIAVMYVPMFTLGFIVAGGCIPRRGMRGHFHALATLFFLDFCTRVQLEAYRWNRFWLPALFHALLDSQFTYRISHSRGASADLRTMSISLGARDGLRPIDVRRHSTRTSTSICAYAPRLLAISRRVGGACLRGRPGTRRCHCGTRYSNRSKHDIHGRRAHCMRFFDCRMALVPIPI